MNPLMWAGRESNTAEWARLMRESLADRNRAYFDATHASFEHDGRLWACCDACWAMILAGYSPPLAAAQS